MTINKPSGTIAGDKLIALVCMQPDPSTTHEVCTPPDGSWTRLVPSMRHTGGTDDQMSIWIKTAGGSEPSTYTFTCNHNEVTMVMVCDTTAATTPDGHSTNQGNSFDVWTAFSVTPTGTLGTFYAFFWGAGGDSTFATLNGSAGWTRAGAISNQTGSPSPAGCAAAIHYKAYSSNAASGDDVLDTDIAVNFMTQQIALGQTTSSRSFGVIIY
jgi:hypothetical protein